ncbi:hypothetical protein MJO29_014100 [Puccinia striiformis f. sp. tritici]|nr:hypothetical protein MJO29_014100 [Puccinia striiformis f. sp. tritici]
MRSLDSNPIEKHVHGLEDQTANLQGLPQPAYLITPLARVTLALARPFSRSVSRDPINSASRHSLLPSPLVRELVRTWSASLGPHNPTQPHNRSPEPEQYSRSTSPT